MTARIALLETDETARLVTAKSLRMCGFIVFEFHTLSTLFKNTQRHRFDVFIVDASVIKPEKCLLFQQYYPTTSLIILTEHANLETAMQTYKSGAFDYISKPFSSEHILGVVRLALEKNTVQAPKKNKPFSFIGQSPAIQALYKTIGLLAPLNVAVLIKGQSGVGKSKVALTLYEHSQHQDYPLIQIDIAAIPKSVLEKKLFGHEDSARTHYKGVLEKAQGGCVLLHNIDALSIELQHRLYHCLQKNTLYRQNGHQEITIRCRIFMGTQAQKPVLIDNLYHTLHRHCINVPALSQRVEDVPLLLLYFIQKAAETIGGALKKFDADSIQYLSHYSWPGNVRQLENLCFSLQTNTTALLITPADLPELMQGVNIAPDAIISQSEKQTWQQSLITQVRKEFLYNEKDIHKKFKTEFEQVLIHQALQHTKNHQQKAAKLLGLSRNTLARKIQK